MYAINKKNWSNAISELETHPTFLRIENFLKSPRLWAIVSSVFVLAVTIAAVAAMALLILWASSIDFSIYDPTKLIN